MKHDAVNHPKHYTSSKAGVECIDVVEHMTFSLGSATKYIWRAGLKGDAIEDLRKARWYLDREIARLEKERAIAGCEADVAQCPFESVVGDPRTRCLLPAGHGGRHDALRVVQGSAAPSPSAPPSGTLSHEHRQCDASGSIAGVGRMRCRLPAGHLVPHEYDEAALCFAEHVSGEGARCARGYGHDGDHDFGPRWPGRVVPREPDSEALPTLEEVP